MGNLSGESNLILCYAKNAVTRRFVKIGVLQTCLP
jgi:hypothetical protein